VPKVQKYGKTENQFFICPVVLWFIKCKDFDALGIFKVFESSVEVTQLVLAQNTLNFSIYHNFLFLKICWQNLIG
jgi:hypothetical protein